MRWLGRVFIVILLVTAVTPSVRAAETDDPAQAAAMLLPAGYTVTFAQTIDLAEDGQQEALVIVEGHQHAQLSQIAALLARRDGAWQVVYRTPADENAFVEIYAYPKTASHPGFVVANWHYCGANCNNGGHTVVRWDGNDATVVLDGSDDRGFANAYPASGVVLFRAPLWRIQDPRCCNINWLRRTWAWRGADLVPDGFAISGAGDAETPPTPAWLGRDGPALFLALAPFQQRTATAAALAPLFAPTVAIQNTDGSCTAAGQAVATAIAGRGAASLGGLWDDGDGYNLGINVALTGGDGTVSPATQADSCLIGGRGIGGYIAHLALANGVIQIGALRAVPVVYKAVPDAAIHVPAA